MADEVEVRFGGSTDGLKQAEKEAEASLNQFHDAAAELGKFLLETFAAEKIFEFTKDAVQEFAQFERAMDTLGAKIKQQGGDWAALKGPLDEYIERIELSTRFNDMELAESISKLTTLTGSYTQAIRINKLAMDFSVGTGKSLLESSTLLGLAAEGNTRGLMQMARAMGITGAQAKDNNFLFSEAERRFHGMAEGENNTATAIDRATHAVKDLSKAFGEEMAPSVIMVAHALTRMVKLLGLAEDRSANAMKEQAIKTHEENVMAIKIKYGNEQYVALTDLKRRLRDRELAFADEQYALDLKHAHEREDVTTRALKSIEDAEGAHIKLKTAVSAKDKAKELADIQKALAAEAAEVVKFNDESTKRWEATGKAVVGQIGNVVSAMHDAAIHGGNMFEALGKSMVKFIVGAYADILEKKAEMDLSSAAFAAANPIENIFSGAMFSEAGAELVLAGAMKGFAATFMADGGYVDKPTLTVLGEDGPEKVTPLSKGHPMDKGSLSIGQMIFPYHGPGGTAESKRFGKSGALTVMETLDQAGFRKGTGLLQPA